MIALAKLEEFCGRAAGDYKDASVAIDVVDVLGPTKKVGRVRTFEAFTG